MQNSRLFEVFNTFQKKEIHGLRKFVRSPFFNQRAHVMVLFDYLVHCKFEKKQAPMRQEAYEKLFPDTVYDDHRLRLSMSLLVKVFEKYLVWQQVSQSKSGTKIQLARAYRERNLSRHFTTSIAELKQIQNKQILRNADYYQHQFELFQEEYLFLSEQSRMDDLNLQQVQENLDIAYITSKLRQSCFSISHQNISRREYDFGLLTSILSYIEQSDLLAIPAISVYYYCYNALINPKNYTYFEQFKKLIFEHQSKFPKGEIRDLFLLAANYCIRQLNQGEKRFAREGLSIYKEGLKNEVLFLNGSLSRFTYRNIVAKAIVSKDFNWAESFIQKHTEKLAEKYRESTYCFNLAWLEYERGNLDKALELLHQTHFADLLLNLSAKTIAMKIYYQLEAFELLYSHLEAMKKFINRKELIAYHKNNYINTIKFTKKLLELPPSSREARKALREEITNTASVAEKNWLLSQL